jgi:predicted negative regulator of RcsB-dependent stress response
MSNSAHELTRKDMKAPDKFQVAATQAATWAAARRKPILVALGALAAAVLIALGVMSWRGASAGKAGSMLFETLVAASGEISSVPLPNVPGPFYKTDAERQKAVAEAAAKVRQEYGGTRAAVTAALAEADARYRLGELDAALAGYQAFLSGAGKDDPLRFAALDGVARVQESNGQLAEAAQTWQQAGELKAFADRATLERARVLAKAGKVDEARQLLSGFEASFKDSRLRPEADERLARLGTGK